MSFAWQSAMFANSSLFRPLRHSSCVIFADSISGRPLTTGITRHICNLNLRSVTARLLACLAETESANETIEKRAIVSCLQIPSRVGHQEPHNNAMLANLVSWRYCRQTTTCRLEIEIAKIAPQTDTTCRVEIEHAKDDTANRSQHAIGRLRLQERHSRHTRNRRHPNTIAPLETCASPKKPGIQSPHGNTHTPTQRRNGDETDDEEYPRLRAPHTITT